MKKIGILTINDYSNYGNRLQNYALQEVLKGLDCNPKTIVNLSFKKNKPRDKSISKARLLKLLERGLKFKNTKRNKIAKKIKVDNFIKFTQQNIQEHDLIVYEESDIDKIITEFDYFITGSDQVWNPNFRYGSPIDFIAFAPQEKKIAYAPSFGISNLPEEYKEKYKKYLENFNHLSVRENEGASIIKKLTGKEVPVVADPTLLLSKNEWMKLIKKSSVKPSGKYIVTYFLGDNSSAKEEKINKIQKELQLPIYNLGDFNDLNLYSIDPSEFLDLINSAELVITDSFHGCVFSILFEKEFVVFERNSQSESMNSRIETLLNTFDLKERHEKNCKVSSDFSKKIDWEKVESLLNKERKKSLEFLKSVIK